MIVNPANGGQNITINPAQPAGYPTTAPVGSPTPGMINSRRRSPVSPLRPSPAASDNNSELYN